MKLRTPPLLSLVGTVLLGAVAGVLAAAPAHAASPVAYVAMGDSGQGLTHGVAGAMLNAGLILGEDHPWEDIYLPGRVPLRAAKDFMAENVSAGSVPIATATSIFPAGRSPSASMLPPDERAMMSTAALLAPCSLEVAPIRRHSR